MLDKAGEYIEKLIVVSSKVDDLRKDIEKLTENLADLRDRVIRLEANGDLVAEKAKNAALQSVLITHQRLQTDITNLSKRLDGSDWNSKDGFNITNSKSQRNRDQSEHE